MDIKKMSDAELRADLVECIQLEGEAKARAEPIRKELLRRQVETGEVCIEDNGWTYSLKREPISAAWVDRNYGYPKKEIPAKCYEEEVKVVLSSDKVTAWLEELGHGVQPTYTLAVARKKI